MKEETINNANKILFYRTVLCFADNDYDQCTVTGIAKKLNVEKYQISRIITTMEQQGIVEKNPKGVPTLTNKGVDYINDYHERVNLLVSFLLRSGVDSKYARDIALHIAGHANKPIMDIIEEKERRMQVKDTLSEMSKFSGSLLAHKVNNGTYSLPYVIINTSATQLSSFFQSEKDNVAKLSIISDKGTIQIQPGNRVKSITYFNNGEYIQAEKVGDIFFLPADALTFMQMGTIPHSGPSFCGMVNIKIAYQFKNSQIENDAILEVIL